MGDEHRRYIDEPYILERVSLEQAMDLLRPLARTGRSALTLKMRNKVGKAFMLLSAVNRDLVHHPDRVREEKAAEDAR